MCVLHIYIYITLFISLFTYLWFYLFIDWLHIFEYMCSILLHVNHPLGIGHRASVTVDDAQVSLVQTPFVQSKASVDPPGKLIKTAPKMAQPPKHPCRQWARCRELCHSGFWRRFGDSHVVQPGFGTTAEKRGLTKIKSVLQIPASATISGWWFGTCFIFPNSWDDDPIWRTPSFFRGVGQPPIRYCNSRLKSLH